MNILYDIEGLEDDDMTAEHMEYEHKPYTVRCDLCNATQRASEGELKRAGWYLGRGEEICGQHD